MFSCARCTYVNPPNSEKCMLCETQFFIVSSNMNSNWNCPLCSSLCLQSQLCCSICGGIPLPQQNDTGIATVIDLSSSFQEDDFDMIVESNSTYDNSVQTASYSNGTNNMCSSNGNDCVDAVEPIQVKVDSNSLIQRHFCSPVYHYSQYKSVGAKWSCGYRNIQMLCSSLMRIPEYKAVLFDGGGVVPNVQKLQGWIEEAWKAGYDVEVRLY